MATLAPTAPETEQTADVPAVRLTGIRRSFGDVVAVAGVDLDIGAGEFFTLLGPSGSGKTTTLRVIAGFERPDAGRVELQGVDVTRVAPAQRAVNTIFQDYALFPGRPSASFSGRSYRRPSSRAACSRSRSRSTR
ncbi:MAG TPA: ATP-binding cassette domain-containing protein [Gaiellaceae bacterium]|nr:ATP-binding cassette domain-containing protein [Gaiellaceae bacterium]